MGKYIICMSVKLNHLLLNSILLMDKGIQDCVESTKKFHFCFLIVNFSLIGKGCVYLKEKQQKIPTKPFPA